MENIIDERERDRETETDSIFLLSYNITILIVFFFYHSTVSGKMVKIIKLLPVLLFNQNKIELCYITLQVNLNCLWPRE